MPLIDPTDRSGYLTTAGEAARRYRERAERAWDDGDTDVVIRMEDAAARLEALSPETIEPLF